jgi:peptide/nickel transport system ATP-binding protein
MGSTEKVFGNPLHPYTKMLLSSVPQLHRKWDEADLGAGNGAEGGAPEALEAEQGSGVLQEVEDDHFVVPLPG